MSNIVDFLDAVEDYDGIDNALAECGHVLADSEVDTLYNDYKYHRDLLVNRLISFANERMMNVEGLN